jgi:hypothetical protein
MSMLTMKPIKPNVNLVALKDFASVVIKPEEEGP